MKHRFLAALLSLGVAAACYQDDTPLAPAGAASTTVWFTDDPFPYDSVAAVTVFVSRIEAGIGPDLASARSWVTIATPNKAIDLLALQQGATALAGEGVIGAGRYAALRMTIDADRSFIAYVGGARAVVHWPSPGSGQIPLYALVERPIAVPAGGARIVIDFDMGRSFLYNTTGAGDFVMLPVLRAVDASATGVIDGAVTGYDVAQAAPAAVRNADVTVFLGDALQPSSTWYVTATGRSDASGNYRVSYLLPGTYIVRAEQPDMPWLASVTQSGVVVTLGDTTRLSTTLPSAGGSGAYINLSGPDSVYVGGGTEVFAAVGDASGTPITAPQVTWVSRDTLIAGLADSGEGVTGAPYSFRTVLGRQVGSTWIVATSGALADSMPMRVVRSPVQTPVASVTVSPATLELAVGQTDSLRATPRDANGNVLANRAVSWFPADSSGVVTVTVSVGPTGVLQAQRAGTTVVIAASDGKTGSATITVH